MVLISYFNLQISILVSPLMFERSSYKTHLLPNQLYNGLKQQCYHHYTTTLQSGYCISTLAHYMPQQYSLHVHDLLAHVELVSCLRKLQSSRDFGRGYIYVKSKIKFVNLEEI